MIQILKNYNQLHDLHKCNLLLYTTHHLMFLHTTKTLKSEFYAFGVLVITSQEEAVKAARVGQNVSCDQPEQDDRLPAVIRLFPPADTRGEGGTRCAPGENNLRLCR